MPSSDWALQAPVTVTFAASDWHLVLRELVYAVSTVEAVYEGLTRTADPKRDAWVREGAERLLTATSALDKGLELLHDAQARPVPSGRSSQ